MSTKSVAAMKMWELHALARTRHIPGHSRMRKHELVAVLGGAGSMRELRAVARRRHLKGYSALTRKELLTLLRRPKKRSVQRRGGKAVARYSDMHANELPFRTALYHAIQSGQLKLDACRVNELFSDPSKVKALFGEEKVSASTTLILLGAIKAYVPGNLDVVLKISFESRIGDNSLEVERLVYEQVTTPLLLGMHTPHVIAYVGSATCTDFENTIDLLTKRPTHTLTPYERDLLKGWLSLFADESDGVEEDYNVNKMTMLLLEQSRGLPLHKWGAVPHRTSEWQAVVLQLLYTLACFNEVGLQHNDLHWGNIFVETLPKPAVLYYVSNRGKTVHRLTTTIFIKIYDFDLSTKYKTAYNSAVFKNTRVGKKTGFCDELGFCNTPNPKYDMFRILTYIYAALRTRQTEKVQAYLKKGIETMVKPELLSQKWPWLGSLCRTTTQKSLQHKYEPQHCEPYIPPDKLMRSPHVALESTFNSLRVDAPGTDGTVYHLPSVTLRKTRTRDTQSYH